MRGTIIIQTLYDFPRSFSWRFFAHLKEGLYRAILLSSERGKSYKFCMMRSKIYGKLYDFHSSLYTLVNIIQSLYDGNTFVCITIAYDSFIWFHVRFWGLNGHAIKKYHKILPLQKTKDVAKFTKSAWRKRSCFSTTTEQKSTLQKYM